MEEGRRWMMKKMLQPIGNNDDIHLMGNVFTIALRRINGVTVHWLLV